MELPPEAHRVQTDSRIDSVARTIREKKKHMLKRLACDRTEPKNKMIKAMPKDIVTRIVLGSFVSVGVLRCDWPTHAPSASVIRLASTYHHHHCAPSMRHHRMRSRPIDHCMLRYCVMLPLTVAAALRLGTQHTTYVMFVMCMAI